MNMIIQIVTAIALTLSIIVPFGCFFLGEKNKKRYKKSLIANCFLFFGVLLVATIVSFAGTASVQAASSSADGLATGLGYRMLIYAIVLIVMMLLNWSPKALEMRERYSPKRLLAKRKEAKEAK